MVQKKDKRPRGRPRAYDPQQALHSATEIFWRTGYAATSLDDLSSATGMNRPSLYAAFGDKRALYLDSLHRYAAGGSHAMQHIFSLDEPLPMALLRIYEAAMDMYYPEGEVQRGCFLIGTAAVEAVNDAEVKALLADALRNFDGAFEARFLKAQETGEITARMDAASLAKLASAILHTLALRSRAGDDRASLRVVAKAGIALLCGQT